MFNNCRECAVFSRLNQFGLCQSCNTVEENFIELIREITLEEGKLNVFDMAEHISIHASRIFRWIEEGRLKASLFKHDCPLCGCDLFEKKCQCLNSKHSNQENKPPEKFHTTIRVDKRKQEYWDKKSGIQRKQKRDIWIRS